MGLVMIAVISSIIIGWQIYAKPKPPIAPKAEKQVSVPDNPLMIEAIRSRKYPGGEIKTEQSLGDQGGYQSRVVSYPSDGLKIYALMTVPSTPRPRAGYPVIILNHGYVSPSQYRTTGPEYKAWIDHYSRNGFMVVKPDYRGHGNSEGTAAGGHFSPEYTYDVLNLVSSLRQYPEANGSAIGLLGHSMGGGVSMRAIVASKDIKATVMAAGTVGGIDDLTMGWGGRGSSLSHSPADAQRPIDQLGSLEQNPEAWRKVDPLNYLDFIAGSIQIHHGTNDTEVPKRFSDRLDEALRRSSKPAEYFVYQGGDHNFGGAYRSLYLQRTTAFFKKALQ